MDDIRQWLEQHGLGEYADAFVRERIAVRQLAELTDDDLRELGLPMGPRKVIIGLFRESIGSADPPSASAERPAAASSTAEAQRRQLTVMFCDLVGSTALSRSIDPEVYRELLAAYQSAAKRAIDRYDGYIARYMGDGLLVYFGYPQAHEDDPERAVRAGLELVDAVSAIESNDASELKVRVGIATGLVVAGDIVGEGASEERAVLGDTPNLAARLQGIAAPNSVVLAHATWRLTRRRFNVQALAPLALKGISEPVTAYRALSVRGAASRFEAAHSGRALELVGRDAELSLLMQLWRRAQAGEGQVVIIEGEAGIGKSRLAEALREHVASDVSRIERYQCSPYHGATAFHPVVEALRDSADFTLTDDVDSKLDKLQALLGGQPSESSTAQSLAAALLSLPTERYPPLNMTPFRQRAETIAMLGDRLVALCRTGPLLLLFEDAHWSDPSSIEVLGALVSRLQVLPALAVITARPGFAKQWAGQVHVTAHYLDRLDHQAIAGVVRNVAANTALPPDTVQAIIARADGVPLFAEELTRNVLETARAAVGSSEPPLAAVVPATLHDALIARLDRLGGTKAIAQIGACLGREFSYQDVAAVASLPPDELAASLSQLIASEIVFGQGQPPHASYTFKHALVRDVAEDCLLHARARQLHGEIADALRDREGDIAPERLAFHYAKAGVAQRAIEYYIQAGKSALSRSAYSEALDHLDAGRKLVATLADDPENKRLALNLHSARAEALTAAQGYVDTETTEAYKTAYELCKALGTASDIFPLLRGVYNTYNAQGRLSASRQVANRCLHFARRQNDAAPLSLGYRLLGQNEFLMAEFHAAHQHLASAVELYDADAHAASAQTYGLDLKSAPMKYTPLLWWLLGYPDRAQRAVDENIRHGQDLGFAFNLALTKMWAYYLQMLRRDHRAARELATSLDVLARKHGIADCIIVAKAQSELLESLTEPAAEQALVRASQSLNAYRDAWGEFVVPFNLGTLASAYARHGQFAHALAAINEALAVIEDTGDRWSEAEIWRLKGEIVLAARHSANEEAKACFAKSLAVAVRQDAKAWQLRSATSQARLLAAEGHHAAARDLLGPIYEWFTEGFETPDLRDARAVSSAIAD